MKKRIIFWVISIIYLILGLVIYETASPAVILGVCILIILMTGILGTIYLVKHKESGT